MNIIVILLMLLLGHGYSWVDVVKRDIIEFENKCESISHDEKVVDETRIKLTNYKFNKQNAIRFDFIAEGSYSISQIIYRNKKNIYADICLVTFPILYKGTKQPDEPDATMLEFSQYYKNKNEGVQFSRSLCFTHGQNIDSLKLVLENLPYEVEGLDNNDYQQSDKAFKADLKDF